MVIEEGHLDPLEEPEWRAREIAWVQYASERLRAGHRIKVRHATEKKPSLWIERITPATNGGDVLDPIYCVMWIRNGDVTATERNVDPGAIRWMIRCALRSSIPIPEDPPVDPENSDAEDRLRAAITATLPNAVGTK